MEVSVAALKQDVLQPSIIRNNPEAADMDVAATKIAQAILRSPWTDGAMRGVRGQRAPRRVGRS
jgi:hypothetical protein